MANKAVNTTVIKTVKRHIRTSEFLTVEEKYTLAPADEEKSPSEELIGPPVKEKPEEVGRAREKGQRL